MTSASIVYVDSSALVKLAAREDESERLRRHLAKRALACSALARTEVARALAPFGATAVERGERVLRSVELLRVSDRVLRAAGALVPLDVRSVDAIHLASAALLGSSLAHVVTYDQRMTATAAALGWKVVAPG